MGQPPEMSGVSAEPFPQLRVPRQESDFMSEVRDCSLQSVPHEGFDLTKPTILERTNGVRVWHVALGAAPAEIG